MQYADGGDITKMIKERRALKLENGSLNYWTEECVLDWFSQIALALKYVHDRKILHRDLKAANIFVTQ